MKKTFLSFGIVLVFSVISNAAEPQIWSVNSRADVMKGDARSVSIDANGNITPAPKLTEIYKTEQPYVWHRSRRAYF
jgi:hypothetical protein